MEDGPDYSFEMALSIIVGHSCARCCAGQRYTALHAGRKIGARGRGNVGDGVVNTAAHDVHVAVGLEGDSVGIGTGWGCL